MLFCSLRTTPLCPSTQPLAWPSSHRNGPKPDGRHQVRTRHPVCVPSPALARAVAPTSCWAWSAAALLPAPSMPEGWLQLPAFWTAAREAASRGGGGRSAVTWAHPGAPGAGLWPVGNLGEKKTSRTWQLGRATPQAVCLPSMCRGCSRPGRGLRKTEIRTPGGSLILACRSCKLRLVGAPTSPPL